MKRTNQCVRLIPPLFNKKTVLKEVSCTRPMRDGCFNISIEKRRGKQIIHCYGHGGAGWTTLFGSVAKALALLQTDRKKGLRVIGSGCIGLTAAIELARHGYRVSGISTKELYDICSWQAAGYFALVSLKTAQAEQNNLYQMGFETFDVYRQIDRGKHPYISRDSVRQMAVYCSKDTDAGVEELAAHKLIPPPEEVTLDFGTVRHENFLKYTTYFMDTTKLMQQLMAEVERLAIPIQIEAIDSFDQVEEEVIFNGSGMGAKELNQDTRMIPVRGHLILLNEQAGQEHMDYMIYTKVIQEGREEWIYMFPKTVAVCKNGLTPCRGAIGGTFLPNADQLSPEELARLDAKEFQKLFDRTSLFFY